MAELGLERGLSDLLDTHENPGISSLTNTLSYFPQTTHERITNHILRMKTLRPREVTQEQVVNKLADLGKLGLGPRSACLQSRLGSGSQSVHPRGLLEKPGREQEVSAVHAWGHATSGSQVSPHSAQTNPSLRPCPVFGAKGCGLLLEHLNPHATQGCILVVNQKLLSHQSWKGTC